MSIFANKLRRARCPSASAVIVAAGSGTRYGGDKLMAELSGTPVLARTLAVFQHAPIVGEIVLVVREDALATAGTLCREYAFDKVRVIVPGGKTRALSCFAGVMAASDGAEIVAIHDGARPLVTGEIIEKTVWDAYRHGAAVPAVPVRDTIKMAEDRVVTETPERSKLFAVQTPQCFHRDVIRGALADAARNAPEITDDCQAVERIGGQIWLSEGSEENLKITTPLDLALAELILQRRSNP